MQVALDVTSRAIRMALAAPAQAPPVISKLSPAALLMHQGRPVGVGLVVTFTAPSMKLPDAVQSAVVSVPLNGAEVTSTLKPPAVVFETTVPDIRTTQQGAVPVFDVNLPPRTFVNCPSEPTARTVPVGCVTVMA